MRFSLQTGSLLHEISNEGARAQFLAFVEALIFPVMVACAQVRGTLTHSSNTHSLRLGRSLFRFVLIPFRANYCVSRNYEHSVFSFHDDEG